ncbi:MAG: signal peptidase I [Clostridia bacterium]|nr:signal peptidase I [Clostridia bacterium]
MKKQYRKIVFVTDEDLSPKTASVRNTYDMLITFASAIITVLVILVFLLRVVTVQGNSMNPTLNSGDRLVLNSVTSNYEFGDIVVVSRTDDDPLIKRVIGVGGDTISINYERGEVFRNGERLEEPYIAAPTYLSYPDGPDFPIVVPEGYLFVMGDNRNDSLDSRSGEVGLIDENRILGKMLIDLNKTEAH